MFQTFSLRQTPALAACVLSLGTAFLSDMFLGKTKALFVE
jgi:hypothetical protein